jgi:hypothetical protein
MSTCSSAFCKRRWCTGPASRRYRVLEPGYAVHPETEAHRIGPVTGHERQRAGATGGRGDPVAQGFEEVGEDLAGSWVVVDDEHVTHPGGHSYHVALPV